MDVTWSFHQDGMIMTNNNNNNKTLNVNNENKKNGGEAITNDITSQPES